MNNLVNDLSSYHSLSKHAKENPEQFWGEIADSFVWEKKWDKVLDWNFSEPNVKWFEGGALNITTNCLDRHLTDKSNRTAILWIPNNPNEEEVRLTYAELHDKVEEFASVLRNMQVKKGDRVCIYMPMIPELSIAVLACARIGAIHSVVFAGFSANALVDRIQDASCNIILTSDEAHRGAKVIPIKSVVDEALEKCPSIKSCIVRKVTHAKVPMKKGRDFFWDEAIQTYAKTGLGFAETMQSEDTLFVLYTSGSTGKPKGVVHSTAGYMVYAEYSFRNVFQYEDGETYWCTADIGWITGHSYIIYGPLLAGATSIMFEGVPTYPDAGRFWQIVDDYQVNIFYTAPTAIRALMALGDEYVEKYHLDSLRVLGTVGEPINEEAWHWYHEKVGKKKCWIVDTWWQTETGGILISPLSGITPTIPTYATLPLPGIQPELVDTEGKTITDNDVEGLLCISFPWPSMIRTTYGDHERCRQVYFSAFKNKYFTGDGARRDKDGNYRIIGRVDDVINVSGHRMGTAEVENAINMHPAVIESAVVGCPHPIKGQGIYAYVICNDDGNSESGLRSEILATVTKEIGPIAKPEIIQFVSGLPKTRSGKIMRRILRKIAEGDTSNLGDISTLLDPSIVEEIKKNALLIKH